MWYFILYVIGYVLAFALIYKKFRAYDDVMEGSFILGLLSWVAVVIFGLSLAFEWSVDYFENNDIRKKIMDKMDDLLNINEVDK